MSLFGPHCHHDECGMTACDIEADPEDGVLFGCRDQAACPHCGPTSPVWPRLSGQWIDWAVAARLPQLRPPLPHRIGGVRGDRPAARTTEGR